MKTSKLLEIVFVATAEATKVECLIEYSVIAKTEINTDSIVIDVALKSILKVTANVLSCSTLLKPLTKHSCVIMQIFRTLGVKFVSVCSDEVANAMKHRDMKAPRRFPNFIALNFGTTKIK